MLQKKPPNPQKLMFSLVNDLARAHSIKNKMPTKKKQNRKQKTKKHLSSLFGHYGVCSTKAITVF